MKQVDWSKWSAIAEILSAVAILITLVYLAVQTRYLAVQTEQNTAAVQASVRQDMLASDLELLFKQIDYPELELAGRPGYQNLTPEQLTRLNSHLIALVRIREFQWLQFKNGVIDERTWASYRAAIPFMFNSAIRRQWWQQRTAGGRSEFDPEFVALVSEILDESNNADASPSESSQR